MVIVMVTLFPTNYMKTSTYYTIAIDDTRNVHVYCASGCQKNWGLSSWLPNVFTTDAS